MPDFKKEPWSTVLAVLRDDLVPIALIVVAVLLGAGAYAWAQEPAAQPETEPDGPDGEPGADGREPAPAPAAVPLVEATLVPE